MFRQSAIKLSEKFFELTSEDEQLRKTPIYFHMLTQSGHILVRMGEFEEAIRMFVSCLEFARGVSMIDDGRITNPDEIGTVMGIHSNLIRAYRKMPDLVIFSGLINNRNITQYDQNFHSKLRIYIINMYDLKFCVCLFSRNIIL